MHRNTCAHDLYPTSKKPLDGKVLQVRGFGHVLCCAWRGDNAGPHSPQEVRPGLRLLLFRMFDQMLVFFQPAQLKNT